MPDLPPSPPSLTDEVPASAGLAKARLDFDERRWTDAYTGLSTAAADGDLVNSDLERLADAAFWTGRIGDAIETRQRLFQSYKVAGDRIGAARTALTLMADHGHLLERSLADGWLRRAIRLLDGLERRAEHAGIGRAAISHALDDGDLEQALRHAEANLELGQELADIDVESVALQDRGRVLLALGRVDEGMADINEAMVAAVSGEISLYPAAVIYCNATIACEDLTDYRSAGEFADAAARWCDNQDLTGFPGMCRVRKVEIIRLKGDWDSAEEEARKACAELADFSPAYAAEGHYQLER